MPNPYEIHDRASEAIGKVAGIAGASTGSPNPMGGVLEAQAKWHTGEYNKTVSNDP